MSTFEIITLVFMFLAGFFRLGLMTLGRKPDNRKASIAYAGLSNGCAIVVASLWIYLILDMGRLALVQDHWFALIAVPVYLVLYEVWAFCMTAVHADALEDEVLGLKSQLEFTESVLNKRNQHVTWLENRNNELQDQVHIYREVLENKDKKRKKK